MLVLDNLRIGIDIGSTTAKVVILDTRGQIVFSDYRRHKAATIATLTTILEGAREIIGEHCLDLLITGSAGMGVGEKYGLPFIQEVVASAEVVKQLYPQVKTLIDVGGEDAKIIFFDETGIPDIRMNGSCAGGTGAFIDEMGTLMNVALPELNDLAENRTQIYPIASRCGVFAKTDVQNLLSRDIAREDIAASIFHALVFQTLATLARGYDPKPTYIFSGGPLTFLPALKGAFCEVLEISPDDVIEADNLELLPALGAALAEKYSKGEYCVSELIALLQEERSHGANGHQRLKPLFTGKANFAEWSKTRDQQRTPRVEIADVQGEDCFLGVDSGSTTSKMVLIDIKGRIVFDYYANNKGNAIQAVRNGLEKLKNLFEQVPTQPVIAYSIVTGYGEDLIRSAFGYDGGMVETLAHFEGAKAYDKDVSFILDIGGQDMKAIFVRDGHIQNIEINEACSSGCGSFIESFARNMDYGVADFAQIACHAGNPCDMGTRCTVFMNSRVKQALREAAPIEDISAGLAYSVIKNALHKVLKITDTSILGEHVVVQGGTFRNPAVQKAMENLIERPVTCPDIAELMGAYGAALTAREHFSQNGHQQSSFIGLGNLQTASDYEKKQIRCRGCENRCTVTKLIFQNQNVFYTGNRCERIYTNRGERKPKGTSLLQLKYDLLFDRSTRKSDDVRAVIGIPRVMNLYENYPFWNSLLTECGFEVKLSAPSSNAMYEKGAGTVMSENICFPAKLAHGHIIDLIEAGVDRIFYPMVFFETPEFSDSDNTFNCPIVSGYPDVISSAINPQGEYGIPFDMPTFSFADRKLARKACIEYLNSLGIDKRTAKRAFMQAVEAQTTYKRTVYSLGQEILHKARQDGRPIVLLMGHPYHIDPHINHKIPDILADFGIDIITEDAVLAEDKPSVSNRHMMTHWEYMNRYLHAAKWATEQPDVEVVQLNSFACAPDAISLDEVRSILSMYGRSYTVIRIDEIESTGSAKLRLRSMIEALQGNSHQQNVEIKPRKEIALFKEGDRHKKILAVNFSHFNDPTIAGPILDLDYNLEALPPPDRESVELGLKYSNNEVCYPCIILVGDIIKALQSGRYDLDDIAVGMFITGGQCRASCYTSLFKRALISAGYENVPIIALTTNKKLHEQPGFDLNIRQYIYKAVVTAVYADAIADMYYAIACREVHKGEALALANQFHEPLYDNTLELTQENILKELEVIVAAFNAIETEDRPMPKVGIVGEIYVKYNDFSNNHVVQWLIDQGNEVVVPSLLEFFLGWFVTASVQLKTNIKRPNFLWLLARILEPYTNSFLKKAHTVLHDFRYYRSHHSIREIAENAAEVISLNHQYGEGWLIAGETITMVKNGITNVLCLQPFGCIANQVVAKGVSKRMKESFPELNLLFLDLDAGVSEVNFFNRLFFFVERARQAAGFKGDNSAGIDSNRFPDREGEDFVLEKL
jgi:predicted CoA-substrate-specific enzyme activase